MPKTLSNIDFSRNKAKNMVLDVQVSAPGTPVAGQVYYNSVNLKTYIYNGSSWVELAGEGNIDGGMASSTYNTDDAIDGGGA